MSDGVEWTVSAEMRELRARVENENERRDETSDINGVICDKVDRRTDGSYRWADRWVD